MSAGIITLCTIFLIFLRFFSDNKKDFLISCNNSNSWYHKIVLDIKKSIFNIKEISTNFVIRNCFLISRIKLMLIYWYQEIEFLIWKTAPHRGMIPADSVVYFSMEKKISLLFLGRGYIFILKNYIFITWCLWWFSGEGCVIRPYRSMKKVNKPLFV